MAKMNLKRSIAMLLVLNMLTGMLPIQALAEEGNTEAPEIVVTITPSEKKESAPAEKTESAPAEKQEAAPAETESAPAEKQESAPAETESAPAEKQEAAPAETESAPAEKQESAPAETESAPAAEVVVETVVEETASYDDESGNEPEAQSETTSFEGEEPELDHDSELTYGKDIGGTVTETTETDTDAEGSKTVTETTVVETKGEVEGGTIEGEETYVESETTNADGEVIGSDWEKDGVEIIDTVVKEETGDEKEQNDVTVELIPGETTEAADVIEEIIDGDEESGNYTKITETDRTVTAETSDVEVTVNDVETGLVGGEGTGLQGIAPEYDETDEVIYGSNGRIKDTSGKDGLFDRNYLSASNADPSKWTDIPPEGEYRYIGTGEHSKYFAGVVKVIYQKDEDGNTVYDENGNPVIEKLVNNVNGSDLTSGGEVVDEIIPEYAIDVGFSSSRAQNFMLMDKNGNRVFAYCCDVQTGAVNGKWYSVSNLEDSEYYAPEAEDHIRSIAMNGYWGTSDIPEEDGSYKLGSLESIKANLLKAIENGEIERYVQAPVRDTTTEGAGKIQVDEDGNPIYHEEPMDLMEIIANMTEGEALLATQAAIWSFANGSEGATSGIDGPIVLTPDWYRNHQIDYGKIEGEPLDDAAGVRVAALYNWLINLETEEESTVVVNDKNFVEDMSITVHDKAEGYDDINNDDNKDNDVYDTDLNFKLAFIPGENDDLLVQVSYTDLDGNEVNIVRRLAGENAEGQDYEDIKPDEDGSYVLKGLKLSENEDFAFDLRLEGTQYLENGVYVYAPVGGRDVSQTFVGIAQGERNVDVSLGVTIKFDVDEDNHVVAERRWHSEKDPQRTERETPPPPAEYRMGFGVGQLEVIEEEVPLAAPPQTGDMSILWFAMIALSGCGLCILNLLEKRKCRA